VKQIWEDSEMKILHVITTIERGGAENQLLVLIREQIKSGKEVHVIYLKGKPELAELLISSHAKIHSQFSNISFLKQLIMLRTRFRENFDVVHAHLPRAEIFCLFLPKRLPIVVSKHNCEAFFPGAPKKISLLLSSLVTKRSARIICISNAVREYLEGLGELIGVANVSTVLYGYDPQFLPQPGSTKIKNSAGARPTVGTVGRLVLQKNYPTLLRAISILIEDGFELNLVCIGSGPLESELQQLCDELKISSYVTWLGRKSDIANWIQTFDLFVLASSYEGFGLVLLESMQLGVPIVAARNSAITEVLGSKNPGLFQTGNADELAGKIKWFLSEVEGEKLAKTNTDRLDFFNPGQMEQRISDLYQLSLSMQN
jgi:glycosyltransferase involved in cell wall biosynthesis